MRKASMKKYFSCFKAWLQVIDFIDLIFCPRFGQRIASRSQTARGDVKRHLSPKLSTVYVDRSKNDDETEA